MTLQGAVLGDTNSVTKTFGEALGNLHSISAEAGTKLHPRWGDELVADKGYHCNEALSNFSGLCVRTYVSEPKRGRRKWNEKETARKAVYANRRRIKAVRGLRLMRRRGELIERSFAHCYETGAMRRTHLRGHENILKRLLVHLAAFDLSLIFRKLFGHGTPREMAEAFKCIIFAIFSNTGVHNVGHHHSSRQTRPILSWSAVA